MNVRIACSLRVEMNASVGIKSATSRNVIDVDVAHFNFIVASHVVSNGVNICRSSFILFSN